VREKNVLLMEILDINNVLFASFFAMTLQSGPTLSPLEFSPE
jgi:hypothetical protein